MDHSDNLSYRTRAAYRHELRIVKGGSNCTGSTLVPAGRGPLRWSRIKTSAGVISGAPAVRRLPENPSAGQGLRRPVHRSRRAPTSVPGDGRANRGGEPVAAAELGADKISIFAKSLAQRGNVNLQVLLGDKNAWPHAAQQLVLGNQRAVGLQQDQEEIEGARPQLYRHAVGDQLPLPQQHPETAEP